MTGRVRQVLERLGLDLLLVMALSQILDDLLDLLFLLGLELFLRAHGCIIAETGAEIIRAGELAGRYSIFSHH